MNADPGRYVLDSFALLAFLQGEAGMPRVKAVLKTAEHQQCQVYLSWINFGEVLYIIERALGLWRTQQTLALVQTLPIQLLEVSSQAILEAAHIKATHPIAYGDAFAVAAALRKQATLLTGDLEFKAVEGLVPIEWLPCLAHRKISG